MGMDASQPMTAASLRKAYLQKSLKAHPDKGGTKEQFQRLGTAYTRLQSQLPKTGGKRRTMKRK